MAKMDWSKWSAIAEILSAIAIVVTLLYLAVQTRYLAVQTDQNNELLRSQAGYNNLRNRVSYREEIVANPELAEFLYRLFETDSVDDFSDVEKFRARMDSERRFLSWQYDYTQIMDGNLSLDEFPPRLQDDGPERQVWESFKSQMRPDFVEWMEEISFGNPN